MLTRVYTGLWNKYRPAILKMMIDSSQDPQSYQLSSHEFHGLNTQKKSAFTFTLEVANGRVVSGAKDSIVAQDLWEILQISPKASELISTANYQFSMDKKFVLRVQKVND